MLLRQFEIPTIQHIPKNARTAFTRALTELIYAVNQDPTNLNAEPSWQNRCWKNWSGRINVSLLRIFLNTGLQRRSRAQILSNTAERRRLPNSNQGNVQRRREGGCCLSEGRMGQIWTSRPTPSISPSSFMWRMFYWSWSWSIQAHGFCWKYKKGICCYEWSSEERGRSLSNGEARLKS